MAAPIPLPAARAMMMAWNWRLRLSLEQTGHMGLRRSDNRGLGGGFRIRRRHSLRGILDGVAHHADHALSNFKFLVFRRECLVFEAKEIAGARGKPGADLTADAGRDHIPDRAACNRQCFLNGTLEEAAERVELRLEVCEREAARFRGSSCKIEEVANELVEFLLVVYLEQLCGVFGLLLFAKWPFGGGLFLRLREFEVGFVGDFHRGAVYVVHFRFFGFRL